MSDDQLIPTDVLERRIYLIRGQRVMLDRDLAELYEVTTGALNQAVKRNLDRFPEDFMFQLAKEEFEYWRSQIVISNPGLRMHATHKEQADKLAELEQRYDDKFRVVFEAIRQPMAQPTLDQQRRQIGFSSHERQSSR